MVARRDTRRRKRDTVLGAPKWTRWPESNRRLPSLRAGRSAIELQRAAAVVLRRDSLIMAYEIPPRYYFLQSVDNYWLPLHIRGHLRPHPTIQASEVPRLFRQRA